VKNKKNIIYLCNTEKGASGGAKIIYHHSEIINNLKGYSSQIVHIKKKKTAKWKTSFSKRFNINPNQETGWQLNQVEAVKNFKYDWFKNNVSIKDNLKFNKKNDFVILPEIFAHLADDLLIKNKIKYGIFVQNGYSIFFTNNQKKLFKAYSKANFILSYSEDITQCVKLSFPKLKTKIIKIKYSIDSKKHNSKIRKKNLITFMSRKLPQHSTQVLFFLKKHLPNNWNIKDLNNIDEKEVYKNLCLSKIFLAFSNLEGLPLPPVEAAIAGNYVIGYTGEGGKDYWKKPIFTEIYSGDIRNFVKQVIKKVAEINSSNKLKQKQYRSLANNFSKENEIHHIKKFLNYIS
tara:strand:- start:1769 stop:2806 length:1038 start_codon:yes stop_codon:yes gene_type:complete